MIIIITKPYPNYLELFLSVNYCDNLFCHMASMCQHWSSLFFLDPQQALYLFMVLLDHYQPPQSVQLTLCAHSSLFIRHIISVKSLSTGATHMHITYFLPYPVSFFHDHLCMSSAQSHLCAQTFIVIQHSAPYKLQTMLSHELFPGHSGIIHQLLYFRYAFIYPPLLYIIFLMMLPDGGISFLSTCPFKLFPLEWNQRHCVYQSFNFWTSICKIIFL